MGWYYNMCAICLVLCQYLYRFPPEHNEIFSSHHHKPHELVAQNLFNLISLFDGNTDTNRIDWSLNEHLFFFISGYHDWIQEQFFALPVKFNDNYINVWQWDLTIKQKYWYLTSTSGLLCLSTTWEEKFSRHIAASSVVLTADK